MPGLALLVPILEGVLEALGLLGTISSAVQLIRTLLNLNDSSSWANRVLANTATAADLLNDSTFGVGAINDKLDTLLTLVAALGTPQQSGFPVTLPAPPSGYGGLDAGGTGDAVWGWIDPTTGNDQAFQMLNQYASALERDSNEVKRYAYSPFFGFRQDPLQYVVNGLGPAPYPAVDFSLLTPTITLADWLAASSPSYTWYVDVGTGYLQASVPSPWNTDWICLIDESWFQALKEASFASVPAVTPPLWPGLANVTLGSPVALSTGLTVDGPMDGVIVSLTSVPVQRGHYTYDDLEVYLNVGGLVFVDDNGDGEFFQSIGAVDGVYVPKTMEHAASCKVRAAAGVAGTITPWTIS